MTALIVDDEPLARVCLRRLLECQGLRVLGEAGDAAQALQLAQELRPDLLLLDVVMSGFTGLQLASALLNLGNPPLLIFVTAHLDYAASAFEQYAVDYLVKPVSAERLRRALGRAQVRLDMKAASREVRDPALARPATPPPLRWLPLRSGYSVHLIRVEEVIYVRTCDRRLFVHTKDEEFRTYYTLKQLQELLPRDQFLRIHESCLVNLEKVEELLFLGNHTYEVRMIDEQRLPVGRSRYAELRRGLGLDSLPTE
jgi:two-component system LytT family response regulator